MKRLSFLNYIFFITVITIIVLLIYATVQQSYRTAANDPQIQMAEDISAKIQQGRSTENILKDDTIDIAKSLSPFVILYNASGEPLRSTGYLNGNMPKPPAGVFDNAKKNGKNWITWQPQNDVRIALVLSHINSSPVEFVAVGRSLKQIENREYDLRKMIFIAWIICVGVVLLSAITDYYKKI